MKATKHQRKKKKWILHERRLQGKKQHKLSAWGKVQNGSQTKSKGQNLRKALLNMASP